MKTKSKLPKFFRQFFGLLEILFVVLPIVGCGLILALPSIPSHMTVSLGQIGLMPDSGTLTVQIDNSKSDVIQITDLQGTIALKKAGKASDLYALTKNFTIPLALGFCGFYAIILELLRRLFRNVERGEIFTERNVHLVHWIGIIIIVFTLLSAVMTCWHDRVIAHYLEQHAAVQDVKVKITVPHTDSGINLHAGHYAININLEGILSGLLVLALGEVFRQGLALKQENELTI
jgi:hypothetical protein